MTLDAVRRRAETCQQTIHHRNVREYWMSAITALVLAVCIWLMPVAIARLGLVSLLAGLTYVVLDIRRSGSARAVPDAPSADDCVAFHRRELARQRDLLRRAGTVHILALPPGVALMFAGSWVQAQGWLVERPVLS